MIYGVGDSHILGLAGFLEQKRIKAATAYGLLKKDSQTQARSHALTYIGNIPKGSWLVLSFGEVDCRCHINKFKSPWAAARRAARRYFKFIDEIEGLNIIIFCPSPSLAKTLSDREIRILKAKRWERYILVGSYSERVMATTMFNYFIKKYAKERNIATVDVFEHVFGKTQYYADWVHLNQDGYKFIKDKINRICGN